jgi:hypothetical protein
MIGSVRCPMCKRTEQTRLADTWPDWYTPRPGTVAVIQCDGCELIIRPVTAAELPL